MEVIYFQVTFTAQKMFFIKEFFGKCDQICSFMRIWSHLLKRSLIENLTFCAVQHILIQHICREKIILRENTESFSSISSGFTEFQK